MKFIDTRDKNNKVSASEAIIKGMADDWGLFVPETFPLIDEIKTYLNLEYYEIAANILDKYLDIDKENLIDITKKAYDSKFDDGIVKLSKIKDVNFLELYHGPTLAFKDMALSILPYLMKHAIEKLNINKEIVILTATSGDTGKGALEAFHNIKGIKIIVFYPKNGVSEIQKLQMTTQEGNNVYVCGIEGNFDDAQTGVKKIFEDIELRDKISDDFILSSANSINIGRLLPQIVYYVYGYVQMVKNKEIENGEKIDIVVPTGNFGNILAAIYAKKMGLPIDNFICSSNDNKILTDFFNTNSYKSNRDLILTSSPSMDILISSNLERYLFLLSNNDEIIRNIMNDLKNNKSFDWDIKTNDLFAYTANEEEVSNAIDELVKENYFIDPHTAVAYATYKKYKAKGSKNKALIASTASPYKFTKKILESLNINFDENIFNQLKQLSNLSGTEIPNKLKELEDKKIIHNEICEVEEMKKFVEGLMV